MKVVKSLDNPLLSDAANAALSYVGDILDSLEIRLDRDEYILVDGKKAVISISTDNRFVADNDKEGMEILLIKKIISLRFSGPLSEILADREIIRLGLADRLFYYYYVLLSSHRKIENIEDFIELNIPWISFYPHDKENAKFLKEMVEKHIFRSQEYEAATAKLFGLLQRNLYASRAISEAETEWFSTCKS
mgnify:CR=1 FL=1